MWLEHNSVCCCHDLRQAKTTSEISSFLLHAYVQLEGQQREKKESSNRLKGRIHCEFGKVAQCVLVISWIIYKCLGIKKNSTLDRQSLSEAKMCRDSAVCKKNLPTIQNIKRFRDSWEISVRKGHSQKWMLEPRDLLQSNGTALKTSMSWKSLHGLRNTSEIISCRLLGSSAAWAGLPCTEAKAMQPTEVPIPTHALCCLSFPLSLHLFPSNFNKGH